MGWEPEYELTVECPRDKHVLAWLSRLTRYDHHVMSWRALRAVRTRPRPPAGHPPPDTSPLETIPEEPETSAWPPGEPLDSPWLDNLSRFRPEATLFIRVRGTSAPSTLPLLPGWMSCISNGSIPRNSWICGKRTGRNLSHHYIRKHRIGSASVARGEAARHRNFSFEETSFSR